MLVKTKKGITICTLFDNETITLDDSLEWSIWLKNVRDLSTSTINSFMKSMERFWIWSLYNPVEFNERFPSYQARYREALRSGFEHDKIGLKMLTIKAIKIANENKDNAMINKLAGDELSSIDYLMGYYTKNQIEDKHFKNFIENIDYGKRSNSYKRLTI